MSSQEWAEAGVGHRAPAQAVQNAPFSALVLAYEGRDFAALEQGQEFSSWAPKHIFLDLAKKRLSQQFLDAVGPSLVEAVDSFDACEDVNFTDYLFLEGLKRFLKSIGLLTDAVEKTLSDKLRWRLEACQQAARVKLMEERCARLEQADARRREANLRAKREIAEAKGEIVLGVVEFPAFVGLPPGAKSLSPYERSLIKSLQDAPPDLPLNYAALTEDSRFTELELKSLGLSDLGPRAAAVLFEYPEGVSPGADSSEPGTPPFGNPQHSPQPSA